MSDVLIVDDSPTDRALYRTILRRSGFRVHEVATGHEALAQAQALRPHAIILDVNLPDTDGHQICRALRSDPLIQGIPVLMLTVRDHEVDILTGLEAGADDYVAKDSAPEVFLARVRRLVRYRQMANTSILNEQLAQIGRLLAGIVHEIRGPVGVIRGNAELMKMQLGRDDPAIQFADPIIRGTQLLQLRLEHLMATVRGGPPLLRLLELAPLVSEAADYFRKGIDSRQGRVQLMTDLERPLPQVRADAGRLIQVLLNLMANAREAILAHRETGQIVLRSRVGSARPVLLPNSSAAQENTQTQSGPSGSASEVSSEPETMGSDPHTGQGVVIEVLDDGPGLPEDLMERVFEPFFTTKETGTGYGLYLACEILREHGGHLTASNRTEGGACFTLWLPSASTVPESSPQSETGSEIAHE